MDFTCRYWCGVLCMTVCATVRVAYADSGNDSDKDIRTKSSSEEKNRVDVVVDDLHTKAVEAYLDNNWDGCIKFFEDALTQFHDLQRSTVRCRMQCQEKTKSFQPMYPDDVEDLHFYEGILRRTLCLLRCKKEFFNDKYIFASETLEKLYIRLKPYEYLQVCYYQKKMAQEAASAAFTFLVKNPEDEIMIKNLKFYTDLPDVDMNKIYDLEAHRFVQLYTQGVDAYNNEDYNSAILFLEDSLNEWLMAVEECRANCEAPFDQGWLPDFVSSVANHFTFCLRCKYNCENSLNSLSGEIQDDILSSHYNYLQFSYYKVGKLQKACQAAESYLLFFPNDKTMITNKKFYLKELGENETSFLPTEEAVKYIKRKQYEIKLLEYIDTEFTKNDKEVSEENADGAHCTMENEISTCSNDLPRKSHMSEGISKN